MNPKRPKHKVKHPAKRPLQVLFCASEVAPFAKTGGLADVAGSLPAALERHGVRTMIVMPRYRGITERKKKLSDHVSIYFADNEEYFNRASYYGNGDGDYPDNLKRFSFFCENALALAKEAGFKPDIVHAHDWQAALLPVYLKTKFASDAFFKRSRSILTVHNLAYQGHFPQRQFSDLGLDGALFSTDVFEFYGKINLLKAGIIFADGLTTVSPTYADEIQTREYGAGLDGVVRQRSDRLKGILNGLDTDFWNPAKDKNILQRFSFEDLSGKAACKVALQEACGFERDPDIPLFCMISRLVEQKGLDLLAEIADAFLSHKAQFVLLGDGDPVYKTTFGNIERRHPANAKVFLGFDAQNAHKIYAGADFFLMPSLFEPCGLSQMISLKYGALPIVRRTGGLADTITDVDADASKGNGIVFENRSPEKLLEAIGRAEALFLEKERFEKIRKRGMKADFSWDKSALRYVEFYKEVLKK